MPQDGHCAALALISAAQNGRLFIVRSFLDDLRKTSTVRLQSSRCRLERAENQGIAAAVSAAARQPTASIGRSKPAQQNLRVAVVFWYELATRKSYLGDRDFRSSFSSLVLVVVGDAQLFGAVRRKSRPGSFQKLPGLPHDVTKWKKRKSKTGPSGAWGVCIGIGIAIIAKWSPAISCISRTS